MREPVLVISEKEEPQVAGNERRESESEIIRRPLSQLSAWQERIIRGLLLAASVFGLAVLVAEWPLVTAEGRLGILIMIAVAYALVLILALARRIPYPVRATFFLVLFYLVSLLDLTQSGLSGDGRVFLLAFPLLALVLMGRKAGIGALVISLLTIASVGWLMANGLLVPNFEPRSNETLPWITGFFVYLLLAAVVLIPPDYVIGNLTSSLGRALEEANRRWQEVRQLSLGLEQQVEERTAVLTRRTNLLEAAAQVTRRAAAIRDIEQLPGEMARLISEHFDLYHTGLFLLDQAGEWAVLKAASSQEGQRLLERGHRLPVRGEGLVSLAATTGRPQVSGKGSPSPYPDLPRTCSEVALPLGVYGRTVGILDLHAEEERAFTEEDLAILQVMADQLALTLENARLLTETQKTLGRLSRYRVEETLSAWRKALLRRGVKLSYLYDQTSVRPLPPDSPPISLPDDEVPQKMAIHSLPDGRSVLVVPIRVYDQTIGFLSFEARRAWDRAEVALVEAAVQQLGLALENARLLEETRRRAEQERLIADITAKVRSSADVQAILRTAVREIGAALGTDRTFVKVGTGLLTQPSSTSDGKQDDKETRPLPEGVG